MSQAILITGATSGIGQACALKLSEYNVQLMLTGRSLEKATVVLEAIDRINPQLKVYFHPADLRNPDEIQVLMQETKRKLGRLDGVVNNAGIVGPVEPFIDYSIEAFNRVMQTNLESIWLLMQLQIRQMLTQGRGRIVNMASTSGLIGNGFGMSAYATSKFALVGLSKAVALEYAKQNIQVNTVCPGFVETPMLNELYKKNRKFKKRFVQSHPIGRLVTAQEIATQVCYLLLEKAAACITGQTIVLDGGLSV